MHYNLIVGNYKRMITVVILGLIGISILVNIPAVYAANSPGFNKVFPFGIWLCSSIGIGSIIFIFVLRKTYRTEQIEFFVNGIKSDSLGELHFANFTRIKVTSNASGMQNQLIISLKNRQKYLISDMPKFSDKNTQDYIQFREKLLLSVNNDIIKK